jgi:hypothetical protein
MTELLMLQSLSRIALNAADRFARAPAFMDHLLT